jgi:hypothetical protein
MAAYDALSRQVEELLEKSQKAAAAAAARAAQRAQRVEQAAQNAALTLEKELVILQARSEAALKALSRDSSAAEASMKAAPITKTPRTGEAAAAGASPEDRATAEAIVRYTGATEELEDQVEDESDGGVAGAGEARELAIDAINRLERVLREGQAKTLKEFETALCVHRRRRRRRRRRRHWARERSHSRAAAADACSSVPFLMPAASSCRHCPCLTSASPRALRRVAPPSTSHAQGHGHLAARQDHRPDEQDGPCLAAAMRQRAGGGGLLEGGGGAAIFNR